MASLSLVLRILLAVASTLLGTPDAPRVERAERWVGRRVMIRFGTVLRHGEIAVDERHDVSSRGRKRRIVRVYRVEKAEGDRLWLRAERGGARGWVVADRVVPLDEAVAIFSEELRACPDDPAIYLDRAAARSSAGDYPGAVADCSTAIRLDPMSEVAHVCRGNFLVATGQLARALADFDEAARLDPRDPEPPKARGWLLATCPDPTLRDPARAVDSATVACELTDWSDSSALAALAASCAASGDFAAAVAHQEKAAMLRPEGPCRVESLRRLALYRDRLPYGDPPDTAATA